MSPEKLQRRHLAAGACLFRQGDRVGAIYRLVAGCVRLVRHLEDGTQVTLHRAGDGESFAEAALFSDNYHCDATAERDSVLDVIPKPELLAALRREPDAAIDFARHLSGQVRDLRLRLELRNIRSAAARVDAWLHLQATGSPPRVVLDRPWTDVAPELGLSREALYRALAALEHAGHLRRSGRTVTLRS